MKMKFDLCLFSMPNDNDMDFVADLIRDYAAYDTKEGKDSMIYSELFKAENVLYSLAAIGRIADELERIRGILEKEQQVKTAHDVEF